MTEKRRRASFGSVYRKPKRGGGFYPGYYVRYTDAWGKRCEEKGGRTKTAANALLRKRADEKDRARNHGERRIERITLDELRPRLFQHWEATLRPTTVSGRRGFIKTAAEHFADRPLVSITQGDVQQFLDGLRHRKGLKAGTVRHHAAVLSSAFEYAVQVHATRANPTKGVKLPKAQRKERPYLTDEQRRSIYAHMPEEIRACANAEIARRQSHRA